MQRKVPSNTTEMGSVAGVVLGIVAGGFAVARLKPMQSADNAITAVHSFTCHLSSRRASDRMMSLFISVRRKNAIHK